MVCTQPRDDGPTARARPSPLIGAIVAQKYKIVEFIAHGGMGMVFEAEQVTLGKRVALKWLRGGLGGAQLMAEREALAAARARHPNVVEVIETVRDGSESFVVMELLHGQTLSERFAESAPDIEELIGWLLPAMRGLARAHRRGVIHRDITPSNLFMCRQAACGQVVKVLDFGLAEVVDQRRHYAALESKRRFGTPMYMSAEQLMGRSDIDARSDVYSFGAVLYEGLAGRAPFEAATVHEIVLKAFSVPPPPLRELNPQVSCELDELVKSAMNKDRDRRPESLPALLRGLERIPLRQDDPRPLRAGAQTKPAARGDARIRWRANAQPSANAGCASEVARSPRARVTECRTVPLSPFELGLGAATAAG